MELKFNKNNRLLYIQKTLKRLTCCVFAVYTCIVRDMTSRRPLDRQSPKTASRNSEKLYFGFNVLWRKTADYFRLHFSFGQLGFRRFHVI